jgi:HEAT repeat protein
VYVVSQHHPADADQLLLDVVKNDPAPRVRRQAVYYLGQTRSERAIAALEELLRTSEDREVQDRALYSLAENGGARTGEILRAVAERESASEALRSRAIHYLKERRGGDNAAYLRALYPRLTSTRLREQVLQSLGEMGGDENVRWMTAIAMDTTESARARSAALHRLNESRGATTSDFAAIFDRLRGREMRERALHYIAQRRDTAATVKLGEVLRSDPERQVREKALYYLSQREDATAIDRVIQVAKSDPDREMRRKAVHYLGQSRDPRAMRALEEIIGQ